MIKIFFKTILAICIAMILLVHGCVALYGLVYENLSDHRIPPAQIKKIEVKNYER